jgi:hypothetical protein
MSAQQSARAPSELDVTTRAALLELRVRVVQHDWHLETITGARYRLGVEAQLGAGAGWYQIADDLDGKGTSADGPGVRVGGNVGVYLGWAGLIFAYGYDLAPASIADRLGGRLHAGGHEVGFGLALRF